MKYLLFLILSFTLFISYSQENTEFDAQKWEAPYELSVPNGWTIERFPIPIGFAPQIPYQGVEDIRFAPGWGKAESNEYWTYAFLWYLDGQQKMSAKIIENNLKEYYKGLVGVMLSDSSDFKTVVVKTNFKKVKTQKGDLKSFKGTIDMIDYMANKPISLNCKVHIKSCEGQNKTFVFYEISPKSFNDNVWQSLNDLWIGFSCKKSVEIE